MIMYSDDNMFSELETFDSVGKAHVKDEHA